MKYSLKDKTNRIIVYSHEDNRIISKSLLYNDYIVNTTKWNITLELSSSIKTSCGIRVVNRCILTDRKNHFNKFYRFSRLVFLKLARNHDLVGIQKSAW